MSRPWDHRERRGGMQEKYVIHTRTSSKGDRVAAAGHAERKQQGAAPSWRCTLPNTRCACACRWQATLRGT